MAATTRSKKGRRKPPVTRARRSWLSQSPLRIPSLELEPHHVDIVALALILFPFIASDYWQLLACLIAINIVAAMGLMILTGFTGLVSLGRKRHDRAA